MKPHEFANCDYREVSLFANSFIKNEENKLKNQIILFDKVSDKIIKMNPFNKKTKYISLVRDVYSELFKEELAKSGNINLLSEKEKYDFVMELQKEEKEKR